MEILFLSHCVPYPPNKGEKIRAFQEITALSEHHRVHLACFARGGVELKDAQKLKDRCASVYAEVRPFSRALTLAAIQFLFGRSLNITFYKSRSMQLYVERLAAAMPLSATVAYALPMVPYAPQEVPVLFDMQDVDSEKWLQYGAVKRFGVLYRIEARRIRQHEVRHTLKSESTFLTARQETALLNTIVPGAAIECMENGVDFEYFDPARTALLPELEHSRFIVFVGTMDYYPNIDAAVWFATEILPEIRRADPTAEFYVVGNNPTSSVRRLDHIPGVTVTGGVPDVRPYVLQARAVVAPLRLARGIQNKVLEALVLGRAVFATSAVCRTFGDEVPGAVVRCDSKQEFAHAILAQMDRQAEPSHRTREEMRQRFTWRRNLESFVARLESMGSRRPAAIASV